MGQISSNVAVAVSVPRNTWFKGEIDFIYLFFCSVKAMSLELECECDSYFFFLIHIG